MRLDDGCFWCVCVRCSESDTRARARAHGDTKVTGQLSAAEDARDADGQLSRRGFFRFFSVHNTSASSTRLEINSMAMVNASKLTISLFTYIRPIKQNS